ncbi:MAG: PAN domain-containing protein [Cyanobacteria bacterium J06632_3]
MTLLVAFPTAASACNCSAHFEARSSSGNFKPDIPEQHFSAHHVRGNGQNNNQCRRDAREDAQSCMSAIWRDRWSPGSIPSECSGTLSSGGQRFRGEVPRYIKRDIERAICCQPSNFGGQHDVTFGIYKRTHGGRGCGPNLQTVQSRFLSDYAVDCLAVRDRENRAGRFCGRIVRTEAQRYDRPGSDFSNFSSRSWQHCRNACKDASSCRSWTWVPPGVQGSSARCWLKDQIPWAKRDGLSGSNRMISGTIASPS